MKFDDLCSLAHNVADSFGSGASLLFNYGFYPYDDAKRSEDGLLEVDFLNGQVISGLPCNEVRERVSFAPKVITDLCARYGQSSDVFAILRARYVVTAVGRRYEVTVTDRGGRTRIDLYDGIKGSRLAPGKHPLVQSI
ncbi:hypothetical protein [Novosphingobium lindaniclasticum]